MSKESLEIQKRHTLNWLIQGASQHAGITLHHLVRDELNALNPNLLRAYDEFALLELLQYWQGLAVLIVGWPPRFWKKATRDSSHPFFGHPLFPKYGGMLSEEAKNRALARCKEKKILAVPLVFSFRAVSLLKRLRAMEAPHQSTLIQLTKRTASTVWGIPADRLEAEISKAIVIPGDAFAAENFQSEMLRSSVIGVGSIVRKRNKLFVAAKGATCQLLTKELVKGTAELICLHGLNRINDDLYYRVIKTTDRIDLEPWMIQSGGELWRRLLAALPDGYPVSRMLMNLARSPAEVLHQTLESVIEQSDTAKDRLAQLAEAKF